jgi:UDPglucose 6-dehydrogenase
MTVADDPYAAIDGAHCIVIGTESPDYAGLDLARVRELAAYPIVVDGRNVLDPEAAASAGLTYLPVGRPGRRSDAS